MPGVILISGLAERVYTKEGYDIIGVDHGAYICALQGVEMKAAIGDFDSVSKTQVIQIQQMAERMEQLPSHKDETDTEEAVLYALAHGYDDIWVYGALGGRLDHELANLYLLMHRNYPITLVNEQNRIRVIKEGTYKVPKEYTYLSFLALDDSQITEIGVAYPLTKRCLSTRDIYAISNEILNEHAEIIVHKGSFLMIESSDKI